MTKTTRNDRSSEPSCRLLPSMPEAFDDLRMSVDRFCLLAGLESLNEMMSADAEALCGSRLSANLTETPAPLGITVGRWR